MAERVIVGMSGGVDSSVAALLLKRQGFDVVGLYMLNWEEEDAGGHCTSEEDYADVRRVCAKLDIPYYTVNFAKEYMERVFSHFLAEYKAGRTPNPDVLCNREIKFGPFLEEAKKLGADYIATGHYCKISHEKGVHRLLKAADKNKDQTYFLNQLTSRSSKTSSSPYRTCRSRKCGKSRSKTGLPLRKKRIPRASVSSAKGTSENSSALTCLPEKVKFSTFRGGSRRAYGSYVLHPRTAPRARSRRRQRRGGRGQVVRRQKGSRTQYPVRLARGRVSPLFGACEVSGFNWIPAPPAEKEFVCAAKFRYRQPDQEVKVTVSGGGRLHIAFAEKQRAVTEGQYAVLYRGEECLGGGVIESAEY